MFAHDCNYYCRGNTHTCLLYQDAEHGEGHLQQALAYHYGLHIIAIEPAREAPPATAYRNYQTIVGSPDKPTPHAWLVTWRED